MPNSIAASGAAAATFAGAGAALAGAAAARIGDLFSESQARADSAKKSRITDLDESRRLACMTLMSKAPETTAWPRPSSTHSSTTSRRPPRKRR